MSPYEVDHKGNYVSHEITHPQRRKRALAQLGVDSLHLRLKGFRHDFHLDLKASSKLVAPGFLIQTLGKQGTKSVQAFPPEDFCFYQGSLRSHKNSSVALSTCKGLVSTVHATGHEVMETWKRGQVTIFPLYFGLFFHHCSTDFFDLSKQEEKLPRGTF